MATHEPMKDLYIVDLNQPLPGFYNFLNSWVYKRDDLTILVDPGPRSTIPVLVKALEDLGVTRLDYVLLTHIHIDHAGGVGQLVRHFPETFVICHPKGIRHMTDPKKLWEGSRSFLGKVADVYGEIAAVPEKNIGYKNPVEAGGLTINIYETPGHAPSHLCYQIGNLLFIGEAAGINYPLDEGLYLRIATPPPFNYETYSNSLEKAASLPVSHICFGHYGYRQDVRNVFDTARNQLDNWLATVEKHHRLGSDPFVETVYEELLANDRGLSLYRRLPPDIQSRESIFSVNSIKGMRDYLEKKQP
ncbi:MAG TPA: MBL fold metallo-hydrolase [Syntrophales bacterium]|nr:MBL fold metallo-hydrolase [Syntrophales bacterium]